MRRITFALAVALSLTLVLPTAVSAWSVPGAWADAGALWSTIQTWIPANWPVTKAGQHMDPDGTPAGTSTGETSESQMIIDPDGAPGPESEGGMHMDPDGAPGD